MCCASNQLLNVIRMFPLCNMFIHTTLNITFYFIALQQNSFCWFWLIWNQHFNSFLSYPSLQNSTQSWVSWGSSESPAETVKPFLLQTNMAHSSRCSLSFQIFFYMVATGFGSIVCMWAAVLFHCLMLFSISAVLSRLISSEQLTGHTDIRTTQRLDLRTENTHFSCQYQEVKAWLVSMTQLALFIDAVTTQYLSPLTATQMQLFILKVYNSKGICIICTTTTTATTNNVNIN